jgi:hypothetical protein
MQYIYGGGSGAQVFKETVIPSWHPFNGSIWSGSCDSGQLTKGGLDDAVQHGKVRGFIFLSLVVGLIIVKKKRTFGVFITIRWHSWIL